MYPENISQVDAVARWDVQLEPFLYAADEAQADACLQHLVTGQTQTIIARELTYHFSGPGPTYGTTTRCQQEAADLAQLIKTTLVKKLRAARTQREAAPIADWPAYIAATSYHAVADTLRRQYRQRQRLSDQLRYLLTHQTGFALWQGPQQTLLCGYAAWREATLAPRLRRCWPELLAEPTRISELWPHPGAGGAGPTPALLAALFDYAGGPVEFAALVTLWAEGTLGPTAQLPTEEQLDSSDQIWHKWLALSADPQQQIEARLYLQRVWQEITHLPVLQRAALLLNLRVAGERGLLTLLPETGIASIRQIAAVLTMPPLDLATIWPQLPWDDAQVARHLGLERQQVVNLRKTARQILTRRLTAPPARPVSAVPKPTMQELTATDRPQVLALLAQDPLQGVHLHSLITDYGIATPQLRGRLVGYFENGQLMGVALLGAQLLFYCHPTASFALFAQELAAYEIDGQLMFGPQERVEHLWQIVAAQQGRATRLIRDHTGWICTRPPQLQAQANLRHASLSEWEAVAQAQAEMLAAQGVAMAPQALPGFRQRVVERIRRGRTWIKIQDKCVVFKAELQSVMPQVVYLEGIWTHPAHRQQGIAKTCLNELVHRLLQQHQIVSLLSSQMEEIGEHIYQANGFVRAGDYQARYLQPFSNPAQ